jgi:hypothetical protein
MDCIWNNSSIIFDSTEHLMPQISFEEFVEFRKLYFKAQLEKKQHFEFMGKKWDTAYTKFIIKYLDNEFKNLRRK